MNMSLLDQILVGTLIFIVIRVCNDGCPFRLWLEKYRSNEEANDGEQCDSNWEASVKVDWSGIVVECFRPVKKNVKAECENGKNDKRKMVNAQGTVGQYKCIEKAVAPQHPGQGRSD